MIFFFFLNNFYLEIQSISLYVVVVFTKRSIWMNSNGKAREYFEPRDDEPRISQCSLSSTRPVLGVSEEASDKVLGSR